MASSGTSPNALALMVKFFLSNLKAQNGHHEFEHLCRHYAREQICRNILPATGPVSAGGDHGRDFETFRVFFGEADSTRIVFACTLEKVDSLGSKIRSDVAKIVAGDPVDLIHVFCTADVVVDTRIRWAAWARDTHHVDLEVTDGSTLAEQLALPELYWVAEQFLHLPPRRVVEALSLGAAPPTLPRRARPLIGRDTDLARGAEQLASDDGLGTTVVITGAPGVGKTEFAIALAESVAADFLDGAYLVAVPPPGTGGAPPDMVDLLSDVLDSAHAQPAETRSQQVARLRSYLEGRRLLLVLDNVPSELALQEVRGIDGGVTILCTSRSKLSGAAVDQARFVELGPLHIDDAARLAAATAPTAIADQARRLAVVCGGLPLAVLIAAAHIRSRPNLDVAGFLDRLADPDTGLGELAAGQRSMSAIIEHSYQSLNEPHATLMQVMGLLPNTTVPIDVVAGAAVAEGMDLTDDQISQTRRILDDLFEQNLVEQPEPSGYKLHDVLYRFARAKAGDADRAWRDRVIAHACLAYAARLVYATQGLGFLDEEATIPAESNQAALSVLERTRVGAVMMVESASHAHLWDPAVTLASALVPILRHLGRWDDLDRTCRCVHQAGLQTGNTQWQASALHNLAGAHAHRGDTDEAFRLYQRCGDVAKEARDPYMWAASYGGYGKLALSLGYADESIRVLSSTLRVWRSLRYDGMLAQTLGGLGNAYLMLGQLRRANSYLRNARGVARRAGDAVMVADLETSLATLLRVSEHGAVAAAEARYRATAALERARAVGRRDIEAAALMELGLSQDGRAEGEPPGADSLVEALRIYRELHDVPGQITALRGLAVRADQNGQVEPAVRYLTECIDLAQRVGDAAAAADAMARLARIHANIGRHDKANELFDAANAAADSTGNDRLVADVRERHVEVLRRTGRIDLAVRLLRQQVRLLKKEGPSQRLMVAQTELGEALAHTGEWQEAANTLRAVAEHSPRAASPSVRSNAFRHLAALYSRRALWHEATLAIDAALALAADAQQEADCYITQANVFARMGRWREASDAYQHAFPTVQAKADPHALLAIHSNQAACAAGLGDLDESIRQTEWALGIAVKIGLLDMETVLRLNLGSSLATAGNLDQAIDEFAKARDIAETTNNAGHVGAAQRNLARAYRDRGDRDSALREVRQARSTFQACGDWNSAAETLALEITLSDSADQKATTDIASTLARLQPELPQAIVAAFNSIITTEHDSQHSASSAQARYIHASDLVIRRLGEPAVEAFRKQNGDTRRRCFVCHQPIAPTGCAELLVLASPTNEPDHGVLTHTTCAPSSIIDYTAIPDSRFELECCFFGNGQPALVIDCIGGQYVDQNGTVIDTTLEQLVAQGFTRIDSVSDSVSSPHHLLSMRKDDALNARIDGNSITITTGDAIALSNAPLKFTSEWYRAVRAGVLAVVFGRNLQGLAADDARFIKRAAEANQLVGAVMPLTVRPPSRNGRCVCEAPARLKYKHCCGRPASLEPRQR